MKGIFTLVLLTGILYSTVSFSAVSPVASVPRDQWIKTALEALMEKDPEFDLERIGVTVDRGTVRLRGNVLTDLEKGRAEKLAMLIPGVKAVENDIGVIPGLNQDIEDDKEALTVLFENPLVYIRDLKVRTINGRTTLYGIVFREEERKFAGKLVAGIPGVSGVDNQIEVLSPRRRTEPVDPGAGGTVPYPKMF